MNIQQDSTATKKSIFLIRKILSRMKRAVSFFQILFIGYLVYLMYIIYTAKDARDLNTKLHGLQTSSFSQFLLDTARNMQTEMIILTSISIVITFALFVYLIWSYFRK